VAGCGSANGKLYADYLTAGDSVFSYTAPGTELGKVGVVFVVDTNSQSVSPNAYRLIDEIVMRNTTRS
jgi:hypothetical protein